MYESGLNPVILESYATAILTSGTAVISDSAIAKIGRTKRPIFWVSCVSTTTITGSSVSITYMGSCSGLPYAEEITVAVKLIASGTTDTYIGSKAFDCDYDNIKITKIVNGSTGTITDTTITVSGVARDV